MSYLFGEVVIGELRLMPHSMAPPINVDPDYRFHPDLMLPVLRKIVDDVHFYSRIIIGVPANTGTSYAMEWEEELTAAGFTRLPNEEIDRLHGYEIVLKNFWHPEFYDLWGYGLYDERIVGMFPLP